MGRAARTWQLRRCMNRWSAAMPQPNDLSRSLVALDQNSTIIAVVELSQSSWLVAGVLPDIERQPCKKLEANSERLLAALHRWRDEAVRAGRTITRIALAFEAGRDGFWLARWLDARGVEAHVIHPSSVAVSREHRRAKTDRLDTEMLKRGFLGWLRGERGHCTMARVPTIAEEDAKRPNRERECLVGERTRIVNRIKSTLARLGIRNFKPTLRKAAERLATVHTPEGMPLPPNTLAELQRDMARLGFVVSQIREIEQARQKPLEQETETGPHAMVRQVARVIGIGIETADMLVHEVLSRPMRDRKAVARYAGLTGSPDESGARRREQGLARAGNARVREAGVIASQAVLIAIGIGWDGRRQVLAVELANRESRSSWRDFLLALKARGLHGVEFVVADDHAGLRAALREALAEAAYQRCYVHFLRNALDYVPRRVDDDCLQELRWLYDRRDLTEARRDLAAWLAKWSGKYPKLTGWVEENIDETLTFYRLPRQHHKHLKSTNMLERLNEEIKRRTHVVRIFPNGESCLRLVRALAVETHENWLEQHRYLNMDDLREYKKEALRRAA